MKNLFILLAVFAIATTSVSFDKNPNRKLTSKEVSRSLAYPVAGSRSTIKDKWGASRAGGIRRHKGIDIHARKGTPVVAISDGVIVTRDHTLIGGKTLWLKSSDYPLTAYYAHLDKQYVREGQFVRKGQIIGTIGNTGNARTTPPHLHFGMSQGGDWINPLPYVKYSPKVAAPKSSTKKTVKKGTTKKKSTVSKKRTPVKRSRR
jgi:murein DD-endopeptidase MepM/ murein hydrolase activator NlpD